MKLEPLRPAWAEVDLGAMAHNMKEIRRIVRPETKIMAVVKANGYGHGAVETAQIVLRYGADRLAVATLGEAIKLRQAGIDAPILVLGYSGPEHANLAVEYGITQTVFTMEMAESLSQTANKQGKTAVVHVKIDTGMGRIGFLPKQETVQVIANISRLKGLFMEGVYTHFAVADHADKSFTRHQFSLFLDFVENLSRTGIEIPIKHAANSAAIIDMPETHLDLVRPGIIIYGLYPSGEVDQKKISLLPVMELKARVSFVKKVGAGTSISYGRKYITRKEALIASLPLGYADGYSALLSNNADILLGGKRVPVVGTVCMDQFMTDASAVPDTQIGDEAVIFGNQGMERISVEEIAKRLNTINYEILCMVSERIPRIYTNQPVSSQ